MRRLIAVGAVLLLAGFDSGTKFDVDPVGSDGAGGIAFDGAPRWTGHTCAVCHTDGPGEVSIRLEADHPELFTSGYQPGMQYHLRVVMENEVEGLQYDANSDNDCGDPTATPYLPCNLNGFALEVDDANGGSRGSYALYTGSACAATGAAVPGADAYILNDGTAAIYSGATFGTTAWNLCWTAPAAGTGTLTAYVAAVDGNGGNGTANFPSDTSGDDVAAGQVPLPEVGAANTNVQGGGCAAGDGAGLAVPLAALLASALGFGNRRRRRRRIAALIVAGALAGGCVHVRPRERETLARRAMKFSPDPAEDQLDLHMQEAREGSVGGYGTAGGGCGCN